MGDQQAPIWEVFYIEGASSYKLGQCAFKLTHGVIAILALNKRLFAYSTNIIA